MRTWSIFALESSQNICEGEHQTMCPDNFEAQSKDRNLMINIKACEKLHGSPLAYEMLFYFVCVHVTPFCFCFLSILRVLFILCKKKKKSLVCIVLVWKVKRVKISSSKIITRQFLQELSYENMTRMLCVSEFNLDLLAFWLNLQNVSILHSPKSTT